MSKYIDINKLDGLLEELIEEQIEDGRFESSAIFIGVMLGHAIKLTVTRDEEEVTEAEETIAEHPRFDCII